MGLQLGVAKWMDWMDMDLDLNGWIKKGRGKFIEGRPVQKEETLQQHDRSHIGL
ncbi:hypothetical protein MTR_5g032950 [Medicago truncatula]|uniref:Uncharacterized protein n=1 Tax=Medicago truncatula TaxID=3880 RepID=G7JYW4_MEDTR|nr:hypothetical protein MTR_5g032950 [Medicago truncatula]